MKKMKNKGLIKYAFNNARLMLHTKASSMHKIRREKASIFHHMHVSDIAYTAM